MLKNYKKAGAWMLSIALMTSCAKDAMKPDQPTESVLANDEISISYDKAALGKNVVLVNSAVTFIRPESDGAAERKAAVFRSSLATQQAVAAYTPSATGQAIEGNGTYDINSSSTVLVVPEGKTFSGRINFNAGGKLIVLGTFSGSTDLHPQGILEIGNMGEFKPAGFNVNGSAAIINNYGAAELASNSIQGVWNNYKQVTFKNDVNLNSGTQFNNYCKVVFGGFARMDAIYKNHSYTIFAKGFHINGGGQLQNVDGAYSEVTGGTIGIDGKIVGGSASVSRLDIVNTTINHLNAGQAASGKLDINFTNADQTRFSGKVGAEVTWNQNVYLAGDGCIPSKGASPCNEDALGYTLLANVAAPHVNDALLSATDVRIEGGFAYVSYHTNDKTYGDTPGGALRIFDVQNPNAPVMANEALFKHMEFNGVEVTSTKLIATGQNKKGALLATAPIAGGTFSVSDLGQIEQVKLPSASAKNSVSFGDRLWVATGSTGGGFFGLNPNAGYQVSETVYSTTGAKYIAKNDTYQALFAAEPHNAYLRIAKLDGSDAREYRFADLKQGILDGKNVLTLDENYAYLALSDQGVAKVDLHSGELVAQFVPNTYRVAGKKVFKNGGYTNAVAVDKCFLYLANGADGVIVLHKSSFKLVGYFNLAQSSNYIAAKDGLLFVATGRDGLNIIKIN